ncbi:hypothetical protein LCGC14_3149800, partial [marine sediment metagenome]
MSLVTKEIRRPRERRYGKEVQAALAVAWTAANCICGKRLVPFLPELVRSLEDHGHLSLAGAVRSQLLAMSPATADRILAELRPEDRRRGATTTKAGLLLKHQVPVLCSAHRDTGLVACSTALVECGQLFPGAGSCRRLGRTTEGLSSPRPTEGRPGTDSPYLPASPAPAQAGAVRKAVGYLFRNRRRMHYAAYRQQGLPIGSGAVESACKTVVQARMKQAGMEPNLCSPYAASYSATVGTNSLPPLDLRLFPGIDPSERDRLTCRHRRVTVYHCIDTYNGRYELSKHQA